LLEAWANCVPVVQPAHGAFPELINATGGGVVVQPNDPVALAQALRHVIDNPDERRTMGKVGHDAVHARFNAATMARETLRVYEQYVSAGTSP
jgi:glycosyltransferase involved in cell wall biosynthesis